MRATTHRTIRLMLLTTLASFAFHGEISLNGDSFEPPRLSWGPASAHAEPPSSAGYRCMNGLLPNPEPIPVSAEEMMEAMRRGQESPPQSFQIEIRPGPVLASQPQAMEAFRRAAAQWEAVLRDPIRIVLDAEFMLPQLPDTIAETTAPLREFDYDLFVEALQIDAADEPDDEIVALLPSLSQFRAAFPRGSGFNSTVISPTAVAKALGAMFDTADAEIRINPEVLYDFDGSDGISPDLFDFEAVVAHEIGHALGFFSLVDAFDQGVEAQAGPFVMDLYRFQNGSSEDPEDALSFTSSARSLLPGGDPILDELRSERRLSSGALQGDGRQASHWKDDDLTGVRLGVMDPTLAPGVRVVVSPNDVRLLDLLGYEAESPDPGIADADEDGVDDARDNCPFRPNPAQEDSGGVEGKSNLGGQTPDGIGDVCQCGDIDDDGRVTPADANLLFRTRLGLPPLGAVDALPGRDKCDVTGTSTCDAKDALLIARATRGRGPSIAQVCDAATAAQP